MEQRTNEIAAPRLAITAVVLGCLTAAACGGGGGSLTGDQLVPGETVYQGEGSAMLRVERTMDFGAAGRYELETELTVRTMHRLINEPSLPNRIFGSIETVADVRIVATGTGGSHTTTAQVPVEYQIDGELYPAPRCEWDMRIVETLLFSQVTSIYNSALGTIPTDGIGDDTLTSFNPTFDPETRDYVVIAGDYVSTFELYDIVLPAGTGCDFR